MRTKINEHENICIGYQVPDGDVNLAYIHTPDSDPTKTINIIPSIYQSSNNEYLTTPDEQFVLDYNGTSLFKTDNIEITDQFALVKDDSDKPHSLYFKATLKNTFDLRTVDNKYITYTTGYMKSPKSGESEVKAGIKDKLVYYGNQIVVKRKASNELLSTEYYKIVLVPIENGRDSEYQVTIYTNFQGRDNIYYTATYKPYGQNYVQEEIINSEIFFKRMYSLETGVNELSVPLRINNNNLYTFIDVETDNDLLTLSPHLRINNNGDYIPLTLSESNNIVSLSTRLRINNNGETTEILVNNNSIKDIRKLRETNQNSLLLEAEQYATEYLSEVDMFKILVPTYVRTINRESRLSKLFKYQVEAQLEATFDSSNPKDIKIGLYYHLGEDISTGYHIDNFIPNMISIMRSIANDINGNQIFDYISFSNPCSSSGTKDDTEYWAVNIYEPLEILKKYDMIIVAGYGELDLSYCGQGLLDYIKDGGRILIDNCGSGEDSLSLINWPAGETSLNFDSANNSTGVTKYIASNYFDNSQTTLLDTYYKIELGVNNNLGLSYRTNAPKFIIPNEEWNSFIVWSNDEPGLAIKKIGTGSLIASNLGLIRAICGDASNSITTNATKFVFNTILENVKNIWINSPQTLASIYHTDNLCNAEISSGIYYYDTVDGARTAKKAIARSIKEFMQPYFPASFNNSNTVGTYNIKVYELDGSTACSKVVMTPGTQLTTLTGIEPLWAYLTESVTQNADLEMAGFYDIDTQLGYPDIPFSYTVTSYTYKKDPTGLKRYIPVEGNSVSHTATISKKDGYKTIMTLDNLPAIGSGSQWTNKQSIFYKLTLDNADTNVNLGFYDTLTGSYIYDSSGQTILNWEDLYKNYSSFNELECYNFDKSIPDIKDIEKIVLGDGGWYVPTANTVLWNTLTEGTLPNGETRTYLQLQIGGNTKSYIAVYGPYRQEKNYKGILYSMKLEPNSTYRLSMNVKLAEGSPSIYVRNSSNTVFTKNWISEAGVTLGSEAWKTISLNFVTDNTGLVDIRPAYMETKGGNCIIRCSLSDPKLSLAPISNISNIVVHAWTDEYNIKACKRTFAIREVQYKDIYVDYPDTMDIRDPWYLRIHNGKLDINYYPDGQIQYEPTHCSYAIPEYHKQVFDPYYPYRQEENDEKVTYLNSNMIKLNNRNILAGSVKLYRRTFNNRFIPREKLTTKDNITYTSLHPNWLSDPVPNIERLGESYQHIPLDNLVMDYDNGTISFYAPIVGDFYATYSYIETQEISIRDVDLNNGIVHTYENLNYRDDIYAKYIYKEEFFEYQGYMDEAGNFHELNLNPSYNRELYKDNVNIIIYLLPYMQEGKIIRDTTIRHAYTDNFTTITNQEPMAIKLADIKLQPSGTVNDVTILDARTRGGGLKEDISETTIKNKHKDSMHFWDISPWDGTAYQSNGTIIMDLPKYLLERMSKEDVGSFIKKYLALGIFPIVNFVDTQVSYISLAGTNDLTSITDSIELTFDQAIVAGFLYDSISLGVPINKTIEGKKLTIKPISSLTADHSYILNVPSYAICSASDPDVTTKTDYAINIHTA